MAEESKRRDHRGLLRTRLGALCESGSQAARSAQGVPSEAGRGASGGAQPSRAGPGLGGPQTTHLRFPPPPTPAPRPSPLHPDSLARLPLGRGSVPRALDLTSVIFQVEEQREKGLLLASCVTLNSHFNSQSLPFSSLL